MFWQQKNGIWKTIGREGVFDADHFEDKTVEERTREADDSGPLGALRMEHKREKLRSLLDTNEKAQKEAAVDGGPATTMQDILGLLKSAGHGKVSASGDGNGDEPSSSSSSNSSDDSSDEEHAADLAGGRAKQRLESFCNAAQKRPVGGASGIATGSAHGSGDNARKKPATAGAVAKNTAASKSSGSARGSGPDVGSSLVSRALAQAPQHESVSMDGRSLRLRASLEKEGQEIATKIPLLVTDFLGDEEKCVWDDPPSREKTKKGLADIKKEASKLVATLKFASKRFSNATGPGKAAAEGAKQVIDSSMHMLELIQRFLTLLCMPQPPLDDFSTAMDEMTSNGVRFTKSLYKYAFWLKARSLMQFERYDELCEMSDFNRDLQKLLDCNMSRSDVADYASIVLQQCISERLTALKEDRVALPISEYREKKTAVLMLMQVKTNVIRDGFTGVSFVPGLNKWIAVLDLPNADPDVLSELVAYHAASPLDVLPADILSKLLHTTKLGNLLLDGATAWQQSEGHTIQVARRLTQAESLIAELLRGQPSIVDMADGLPEGAPDVEDYIAFFDLHIAPIEKLVAEVLDDESVSDKVALKRNKKLASSVKKLENRRTEMWDFVRRAFLTYAKEAIHTVIRLVSEAIENNGEVQLGEGPTLVNTAELRAALEMPGLEDHSVVSHRVVDNASKVAFLVVVKKYKLFVKSLSDMIFGALCIKSEKVRTLCAGTGPSVAQLRDWSVFDVDPVMEYSRDASDGVRALLTVVKKEFINMSFGTFKTVKDMVVLFVEGQGQSIAKEQIDRVAHELQDMVDIAGEHAPDHLRSFVDFCVKILNAFAATLALTAKSSPDERSQCIASLKYLQANWPLAEYKESAASGLDSNEVQEAISLAAEKIQKSMGESMQTSLTNVRKHIKALTKLLAGLDVADEAEFRLKMVGSASKLATAVQKLKTVSDQVSGAYKIQGISFDEEQRELAEEVSQAGSKAMYHITVYAAMSLYRDAQTWAKTPAAKQALANLKHAMNALNGAPELVALEISYNHQVVAEMRAELKLPRPSTKAKVSDQSVSTGSEPKISGEQVGTLTEATVSDPSVSTSSAATASGPSVSANSAATVSGENVPSLTDTAVSDPVVVPAPTAPSLTGTTVSDPVGVPAPTEVPAMKKPAAALATKRKNTERQKREVKKPRGAKEVVAAAPGSTLHDFMTEACATGSAGEVAGLIETGQVPSVTTDPGEVTELDENNLFSGFNEEVMPPAHVLPAAETEEAKEEVARIEEEAARLASTIANAD